VLVGVRVSPKSLTVAAGKTQQFTAIGVFSDSTTQVLTSGVTWSTQSPAIATVDSHGVALGITQGVTTVNAFVGSLFGSSALFVGPPALVSLRLTPSNTSVPQGVAQQFQAVGVFSDNSTATVFGVNWTSADKSVATISPYQGTAMTVGQGSTGITASLTDNGQLITGGSKRHGSCL
jgi:hypothetical protein